MTAADGAGGLFRAGDAAACARTWPYLGLARLKASTLRRWLLAGDLAGAAAELRKWVRGGGRVLPGLVLRREAEAQSLVAAAAAGVT